MIKVERVTAPADYQAVLAIRRQVFIEEQGVPAALELDEHEQTAWFFLAREDGAPVGAGRFRVKGEHLKFERIATLKDRRGRGVGRAVMAAMEAAAAAHFPALQPYMHAQLSAVPFYEKLGWTKQGAAFTEAGIVHYAMTKPAGVAAGPKR